MLVRSAAIEQVGLMDESYFMYVEEVDWCRRIRRAGWEIWCEPRAVVVHHEGQSTRQFRETMYVQLWQSRLQYFRKYFSPIHLACVRAAIRLGLWNERRLARAAHMSDVERERRLGAISAVRALCAK